MTKTREPIMYTLSIDAWVALLEQGEGQWIHLGLSEYDGDFLVLMRNRKLLAYLQHQPHKFQPQCHVLNRIETRPYYRRRGYARALIEHVKTEYRPQKMIARGVQPGSIDFWHRMGFTGDGCGPDVEDGILYNEGNFVWKG